MVVGGDEPADRLGLGRPSAARMYDYHLGGSHNFAVDRQMAERATAAMPDLPLVLRANRSFLRRAVQFLVAAGVDQFLDLGRASRPSATCTRSPSAPIRGRGWSTSTSPR